MSKKTLIASEQLDRLTESIVADILDLSDEEIVVEAKEQYGDPKVEADRIHGVLDKAIVRASKAKLIAAKHAVASSKTTGIEHNVVPITTAKKRDVINRFVSQDQELQEKLTLAARKGEGIETDNDVDGMFDDLVELGIIDEQGNPK